MTEINVHITNEQNGVSYTVEFSILVLGVDLLDVVNDVVIQRLAEQFVWAAEQSETQLQQRSCRNKTFAS